MRHLEAGNLIQAVNPRFKVSSTQFGDTVGGMVWPIPGFRFHHSRIRSKIKMLKSCFSRLVAVIAGAIFMVNVYYVSTIYSKDDLLLSCGSLEKAPQSSYGGMKRQILSVRSAGKTKYFYIFIAG